MEHSISCGDDVVEVCDPDEGLCLHIASPKTDAFTLFQTLVGALLVVQGLETCRFLGDKCRREVRVTSMRKAQMVSGIIDVVSVILLMPAVQSMNLVHVRLSQIIDAVAPVPMVLPIMW